MSTHHINICTECDGLGKFVTKPGVESRACQTCDGFGIPPIDMIIFCPRCGMQHVDEVTPEWSNPPHRSHECQSCRWIFRVADVPTSGVREIQTSSERDDPPIRGSIDPDAKHEWNMGES